ncbi:MAG: hypothetical protein VX793_07305, partial [Pseudomonadota bacterium]|nr:hypothetical protein [Pseudomonadota bacterium]
GNHWRRAETQEKAKSKKQDPRPLALPVLLFLLSIRLQASSYRELNSCRVNHLALRRGSAAIRLAGKWARVAS